MIQPWFWFIFTICFQSRSLTASFFLSRAFVSPSGMSVYHGAWGVKWFHIQQSILRGSTLHVSWTDSFSCHPSIKFFLLRHDNKSLWGKDFPAMLEVSRVNSLFDQSQLPLGTVPKALLQNRWPRFFVSTPLKPHVYL